MSSYPRFNFVVVGDEGCTHPMTYAGGTSFRFVATKPIVITGIGVSIDYTERTKSVLPMNWTSYDGPDFPIALQPRDTFEIEVT